MTDDEAKQLLELLNKYNAEYGTSSWRMTVEELWDDLVSSLPAEPE